MAFLSTKLPWDLSQTKWASTLNPILKLMGSGTSKQVLIGGTFPEFSDVPYESLPLATQTTPGAIASAGQIVGTNTNDQAKAGNIGEIITSTNSVIFTQSSPSFGTFYDVTGLSIPVPSGAWLLFASGLVQCQPTGAGAIDSYIAIRNGSTIITQGASAIYSANPAIAASTVSLFAPVYIPENTTNTYKISIATGASSGSPTATSLSERGDIWPSYITAFRCR